MVKITIKKLILIVAFIFLSSSFVYAENWAFMGKNERHTGDSEDWLRPPLSERWEYKTDSKIIASPVIFEDILYVGDRKGTMHAINTNDGKLLWKFVVEGGIDSTCAVNRNGVFFNSREGIIYRLNPKNGELIWKYPTYGIDCASPVIGAGRIFCGTGGDRDYMYALDDDLGILFWTTDVGGDICSSPAFYDWKVYVGSNDGYLYCFNKDNGKVIWKFNTEGQIYFVSPVINKGNIYLAPGGDVWTMFSIDAKSGEVEWEHEFEDKKETPCFTSNAAVGDGKVFVVAGFKRQYLYCLEEASGIMLWKARLVGASSLGICSSPVIVDELVYVMTSSGRLRIYKIDSGERVWEERVDRGVVSSPIVVDETIYICTLTGRIFAYE